MTTTRPQSLPRAIATLAGAATFFIVMPWGVARLAGGPHAVPSVDHALDILNGRRVVTDSGILHGLVTLFWVTMAWAAIALIHESVAWIVGRSRQPAALRPARPLVRPIVASAAFVLASLRTTPEPSISMDDPNVQLLAAASPVEDTTTPTSSPGWHEYVVQPGDTVAELVAARLPGASKLRIGEVVDTVDVVNKGRPQPSYGGVFFDASVIHPGWTILLPEGLSIEVGAAVPPPASVGPRVAEAPVSRVHIVEPNESLSKIAAEEQVAGGADELVDINRGRRFGTRTLEENPDLIYAGWDIWLEPPAPDGNSVVPAPQATVAERPPAHRTSGGEPGFTSTAAASTPLSTDTHAALGSVQGSAQGHGSNTNAPDKDEAPAQREHHEPHVVVRLPSGSVVALAFAAGVASSAAAVRINRRRAYRPGRPTPGLSAEPALAAPLPVLVRAGTRTREYVAAEHPTDVATSPPGEQVVAPAPSADVLAHGTLRFVGDPAANVTTALVLDRILHSGADDLRVIVDEESAGRLFGATSSFPGFDVVATTADALDEAEIERARRARILGDVATVAEYRAGDGDELLADVLVVGTAKPADVGRWTSLAGAGPRLGIALVLVGGIDVGGTTVHVDARGVVTKASTPELVGVRFDRTMAEDASVVVAQVALARRGPESELGAPRLVPKPFPFEELERTSPTDAAPQLLIQVLGPVGFGVDGRAVLGGVREAGRDLLAYLVLQPGAQHRDVIIDELWPDLDFDKARYAFKNALRSLREDVWKVLGRDDTAVVESATASKGGSVYRLEAGLFDADLWRFQRALRDAAQAPTDAERIEYLRRALDAYHGDFADGSGALWAISERENLREQAVNAAVSIAEAEEAAGNPEGAITAVERAIEIDGYAEDLYVRGVRLLTALDRIEGARNLARALDRRLEELGQLPMPATTEAVGRILSEAERRRSARETLERRRAGSEASANRLIDGGAVQP